MLLTMTSPAVYAAIAMLIYFNAIECDLTTVTGPPVEEPFPQQKCESALVNCHCYDYEGLYGIVCEKAPDFSIFAKSLAGGAIFDVNTTYEISLFKVEYLPPRLLDGLIVYRLILDDPDLNGIDQGVFEGVLRLRRFQVRQSQIKEIPDFRKIRLSIRNINIDNSKLTSLQGQGLQDLYLLESASFVNNSIQYIDADVFKGSYGIIILDLSHNRLTSLPPNLLDLMQNLRKLVLSYNHLLHVDQLFAVTHPRFIYLDFNNLTDADSILYPNMTNVETVILASNPIRKTSEMTFKDKISNARFIYMDHCLLTDFAVQHFEGLTSLRILDLSYNLIEEITNQTIDIGVNLEIDMNGNRIRRFDAEITYSIKRIYLNENKLRSLGRTLQFTQMSEVSVARNELQYISAEDFRGVHATANLEFQGNQIQWIDRLAFLNIRNDLHYLDLSSNMISALNGSIRYLSQLKLLNMSDNLLETFERGEFTGLNELAELYLQHNRIKDLGGQMQLLPQLQYIVITHNNVDVLKPEQIPRGLKYIYLAENPIKCNCRMMSFLLWLNNSESPGTDIRLCPPTASDKQADGVDAACPDMCSCFCDEDRGNSFMSLDCSSRNLSAIPSFLTADFLEIRDSSPITFDFRRSLAFEQNTNPEFRLRDRMLGIDLENNSIESFNSAQLPADLVHLYLSNNNLRMLPDSILYSLKHLRRISLSGNPWDCDCHTIGFKQWLLSNLDIVQDVNNTRCGISDNDSGLDGKIISLLTDLDLCPADIGLYVSVAFGVLIFLLLCLATKILYTRYELNIKVYLYSHGFTWVKEQDLDHDKQFDAFISFSHRDEAFVTNEIIKTIERKDPNIRLCIHYKHFRAGEFIHDNILYAVQNSKRTVLVLSRNFLESEWCLMEFRAAHVQALEDKVHRIIVIKVGELPKEIDPSIKVYLDSTTYLTWGDKYFWNNLLYVLPTSGTPRNAEQNGNIKLGGLSMIKYPTNIPL